MPLTPGTRLGAYEVVSLLGEGGMGQVYRARDTKLNRDVALKILPEAFTLDGDRIARFRREAQVLAALNHPHIAAIYGFDDSGSTHALVMELVEGPTLADSIAKGAVPLEEALPVARQIAEALEAAHEQGIVHRDLKPANIKIRDDGTVKVLDFGLAKLMDRETGGVGAPYSPGLTNSPTITTPAMMTGFGVILGTAAYMSPEQAKGRAADKRSDVWGFGCVLYEMLTGTRAFDGEDATDTIAAVVRAEPKWDALPADVPSSIRLLLHRCLEKDRKKRVGDISTALFVLNEMPLASDSQTAAVTPAAEEASLQSKWRYLAWSALAGIVASALSASSVWIATRPNPPRVARFELTTSGPAVVQRASNNPHLAISRDGSKVIYTAGQRSGGFTTLFVRSVDGLEAAPLTNPGFFPFVSPDGEWVGFFSNGGLRKVAITGGPSVEIAKYDGGARGATWGPDDTIIFSTNRIDSGLIQVAASGGKPTVLTQPDKGTFHLRPSFLPGGRAVLFSVASATAEPFGSNAQIAVLDLRSAGTKPKVVLRGGSDAHYLQSGHLVYVADNSLRAVRFDLGRLEARGSPVPVLASVATVGFGLMGEFDVADDGTLVYLPQLGTPLERERSLTWVDRGGNEKPIAAPPRAYLYPRLSPDGTRVAVDVREQDNDIWVWDLVHENAVRVTKDPGLDRTPVWSADGESIFFSSTRAGQPAIFRQRADGTGAAESLTQSSLPQYPLSLSADGALLLFHEGTGGVRGGDLMALQLQVPGRGGPPKTDVSAPGTAPKPSERSLIKTAAGEDNGVISPDGRWLAYQSNESGDWEIYVQPMRDLEHSARGIISRGGGVQPRWSRDGRELFYVSLRNEMMAVPVRDGDAWSSGTPVRLFDASLYFIGGDGNPFLNYDVAKDGRFLMIKPKSAGTTEGSPVNIVVVRNWFEELKQRLPVK